MKKEEIIEVLHKKLLNTNLYKNVIFESKTQKGIYRFIPNNETLNLARILATELSDSEPEQIIKGLSGEKIEDVKAITSTDYSVEEVLDEREALFQAFDAIQSSFRGRTWLMEGRGAYPDDDERYKEEVRYIMNEFEEINTNLWKQIKSKTFEYRNLIEEPLKKRIKELESSQFQQEDKAEVRTAEAMFEKMELTAFNLEKKITKLEELIRLQGELWNNIDMSSYSVSKHWETLHKQINKLKKELKL